MHPQLRQASIEADVGARIVKIRFEYDGEPLEEVIESCAAASAECIADFPSPWNIEEENIARPAPQRCQALRYLVYKRAEPEQG